MNKYSIPKVPKKDKLEEPRKAASFLKTEKLQDKLHKAIIKCPTIPSSIKDIINESISLKVSRIQSLEKENQHLTLEIGQLREDLKAVKIQQKKMLAKMKKNQVSKLHCEAFLIDFQLDQIHTGFDSPHYVTFGDQKKKLAANTLRSSLEALHNQLLNSNPPAQKLFTTPIKKCKVHNSRSRSRYYNHLRNN